MTAGSPEKASASLVTMMRFFSRMTGDVLQVWQREETSARMSSLVTMRVSGYFMSIQRGGVAEGVQRMVEMPFSYSFFTMSLSHERSNSPSFGSIHSHANSPMRTALIPSSFMRAISFSCSELSQSSG